MTMATSIECRVPLLANGLVDLALAMPSNHKISGKSLKHVLKLAMGDVLPQEILYRPKRGFGAPMGMWLKSSLSGVTDELLSDNSISSRGIFDAGSIHRIRDRHAKQQDDFSDHLQALVNLEVFARIYVDGRSVDDVAGELTAIAAESATSNGQ